MNAYENYRLFTISLIIPRILCKFAIPKYIIEYGTSIEYLQHAYEKEGAIHTLHEPHVGMYVCGPTVYGDAHLGHARPAITFDLLFRYLTHLGYKVRYVRNTNGCKGIWSTMPMMGRIRSPRRHG